MTQVPAIRSETDPVIARITPGRGIADQVFYRVTVHYGYGPAQHVVFVGSEHGGPVVMVTDGNVQTFVTRPKRFGERLNEDWVRNFYAPMHQRDMGGDLSC